MSERTTLAELEAKIAARRYVSPATRAKTLRRLSKIFVAEGADAAQIFVALALPTLGLPPRCE